MSNVQGPENKGDAPRLVVGDTGSPMLEVSDAPVQHHYNVDHTRAWRPNPTMKRERGYKIGEPNAFYTQPGHPMNPNFKPEKTTVDQSLLPANYEKDMKAMYGKKAEEIMSRDWRTFAETRRQMNIASSKAKMEADVKALDAKN